MNILIGLTGSVATSLAKKLILGFRQLDHEVKIVATKNAGFFLRNQNLPDDIKIYNDIDEWPEDYKIGDPILHIELRRWADKFVIAPLDMNTLAKLANGMCDNLLTSVFRAWDWNRDLYLCPAANTLMWENAPTDEHIQKVRSYGAKVVFPVRKELACGDVGVGAMASISDILSEVLRSNWTFPLDECSGIPVNHHPGAFGFRRRKNYHTGIDLYCNDGDKVRAVERGIVVRVDDFTGPSVGHDWWEPTQGVMVEGPSSVVNYGEVTSRVSVGDRVYAGECIAYVKRVLHKDRFREDIPGHSCSMLHLELYKRGSREFIDWEDGAKPDCLLDPTPHLFAANDRKLPSLTWSNTENKTVG